MRDPFAAIELARAAAMNAAVAERIASLLEVTSLRGDETPEEVASLTRQALRYPCAAICVYPHLLPVALEAARGRTLRLATVVNFPDGSDDLLRVRSETREAVALGAQEIDAVAPLAASLAGDIELIGDVVRICREAAGPGIQLKIILETGLLAAPATITAMARAAVMAGADFLETATGKREPGASLEATAFLLAVIQEADGRIGLKLAGGINSLHEAASYLALVDAAMGPGWASPTRLRFGTRLLLDELQAWL